MNLEPGSEYEVVLSSERPIAQSLSEGVFVSRSPQANVTGIYLQFVDGVLDLTGWGGSVYVMSPNGAEFRVQGGAVIGASVNPFFVVSDYPTQTSSAPADEPADEPASGGGSNWDPSDSSYSAQVNAQAGSTAYTLDIALQAYSPMNGSPAPYDGNVTYTLGNWTTISGPSITNTELSYQTTSLDAMTTETLYFDSAGMWQGTATLTSSDPNHGSTTVSISGEVYSAAVYNFGLSVDGTTLVVDNLGTGNASSWAVAQTLVYNGPAPSDASYVVEGVTAYDSNSGENYTSYSVGAGNDFVLTNSSLTASTGAASVEFDAVDGLIVPGRTINVGGYWLADDGSWRTGNSGIYISGDNYTT